MVGRELVLVGDRKRRADCSNRATADRAGPAAALLPARYSLSSAPDPAGSAARLPGSRGTGSTAYRWSRPAAGKKASLRRVVDVLRGDAEPPAASRSMTIIVRRPPICVSVATLRRIVLVRSLVEQSRAPFGDFVRIGADQRVLVLRTALSRCDLDILDRLL